VFTSMADFALGKWYFSQKSSSRKHHEHPWVSRKKIQL